MAGWDPQMMTPTLYTNAGANTPLGSAGLSAGASTGAPHHGLIGLVLISVLGLFLLDRAGIKFFVTAGKR